MASNYIPEGWEEITEPPKSNSTYIPSGWEEVIDTPKGKTKPMELFLTPEPKNVMNTANALARVESGGDYSALGVPVKGDRAYGKYQIMGENIPEWSKKYLGKEISSAEFLKNPEFQDKIAHGRISELMGQGHSPQDVASIWLSGRPLKNNNAKDLGTGLSVPEYVSRFNEFYQNPDSGKLTELKQSIQHPVYQLAEWIAENPERQKSFSKFASNPIVKGAELGGDIAGGIGTGLFGGAQRGAQSVADIPVQLINLFSGSKIPTLNETIPNVSQFGPQSMAGKAGSQVGQIGGELLSGEGAYNALGRVPGLSNSSSMAANILRGAGAGAATGEEGPGGRLGAAAIGGALSPLSQFSNKAIADRIAKERMASRAQGAQQFKDVFSFPLENEFVKPVVSSLEPADFSSIKQYMPKRERLNIEKYFKEPTLENAHFAQSDIYKKINKMDSQPDFPGKSQVMDELEKVADSIDKGLSRSLSKKSSEHLGKYNEASEFWKNNVSPFDILKTKNKSIIEQYGKGKVYPKELIDKLIKNKEFRDSFNKRYDKQLKFRELLNKAGKAPSITGGLSVPALGYYVGLKQKPGSDYEGSQ